VKFEAAVAMVLALQFAAFGWRINREISVGDEGRQTWLPISDYTNIVMFLVTVFICIVVPLATGEFSNLSKAVLGSAVVFIAFHPMCTAAHYCLLTGKGRKHYIGKAGGYPYITYEEAVVYSIGISLAVMSGYCVYANA